MKLILKHKKLSTLPKAYTRVELVEKGVERLVERGGVTTLEIVAGKPAKLTPRTFRALARGIVQSAKKLKLEKLAIAFDVDAYPKLKEKNIVWVYETLTYNMLLADYEFLNYKSKKQKSSLKEVFISTPHEREAGSGLRHALILAKHVNMCRDIANTPGGDLTPSGLAEAAKTALKGTSATVSVLDEKEMQKLGMGGILGVGGAAKDKPRFIILEYRGQNDKNRKNTKDSSSKGPIVFVGKGITFDTGGLQVKPGMAMYEMHMDMSGGAAVIAAVATIASLKLPVHVVGLIPAAENAISDSAIRPGDVLKMMSGKTVEVLHTDAEGRLILADALHYARTYKPRLVVDVATLTGASLIALGQHAHAIMTKDRELEDALRELGEETGDYVAPLPLWDEYMQYTKGVHGDIANIPQGDSKYGGTINGASFLSHFTKGLRWVHIDMAPRMTSVASDKLAKGATGEPTRLLVAIAEQF